MSFSTIRTYTCEDCGRGHEMRGRGAVPKRCPDCRKAHTQVARRAYNAARDPEKRRAEQRSAYAKRREHYKARMRASYQANRNARREYALVKRYGITAEQYDRLLAEQGGLCGICRKPSEATLVVDHDHDSGAVRGLLCGYCNLALGQFADSADLLGAALEWVSR